MIAIPTGGMFFHSVPSHARNQTRADSSYCSLSSQRRSNRLHNLPPALLFAARHTCHIHIHTLHTIAYTLCTNDQPKEKKEREKGAKEREREERVILTTGSTVYEKCSTRTYREKKKNHAAVVAIYKRIVSVRKETERKKHVLN